MALSIKDCRAVMLAGGQSRRMGQCKALLLWDGETLLSRLSRRLSLFDEVLLSANDPEIETGLPLRTVADRYPGAGPLSGLHSALSATGKQALFCIPCDQPYFSPTLAESMVEEFPAGAEALVCRDSSQHVHPLCGIYTKAALPHMIWQLEMGNFRMMDLLPKLKCVYFDTARYFTDQVFFNMNAPPDYHMLTNGGLGQS